MRNIQEKLCVTLCTACAAFSIYSIGYANGSTVACADPTDSVEPTVYVVTATNDLSWPTESVTEAPTEIPTEPPAQPPTEPPEFPEAQRIWDFLKSQGFSDNVSAGIMGNMMAEVGGQTLNIQPELYDAPRDYYGICQWNRWYYPDVQGKSLDFQLLYLSNTIKSRFSGSEYERFLNSDNPRVAARRFAIWYEGCAEWSYPVRERNAQKAYDYFVKG